MNIQRLEVEGFGLFSERKELNDFSPGLNLLIGKNESGKSTIREALVSLIYGFDPANREKHPYAATDMPMTVMGELEVGNEMIRVERILKNKPSASITGPLGRLPLGNRPLDAVKGISGSLYRQVGIIHSGNLDRISEESWRELLQEWLWMSESGTGPGPEKLIEMLEKEAMSIWRPDLRGKPLIRKMDQELQILRGRYRESVARQNQLDALDTRIEILENEMELFRSSTDSHKRRKSELDAVEDALALKSRIEELNKRINPSFLKFDETIHASHWETVRLRKESIESSQDACKQRLQQRQKRLEQLHRELRDKTNGANKSTLQLYKDRWNECVRQTEKMVADAQHDRELFLLSTALMPGNRWESIGDQSDSIRNQLLRAMELSRKMEQNSKTNDTARTIGYEHVLTVLISMGLSFQSYLILKGLMPPAGALFSAVAVFIGLVITSIAYMSYRKRKLDTSEWARGTGERTERDWCCQELSDCLGGDAPGFARFAESGSESAVQQAFAGFGKWNDAVERCLSQRRVQESLLSEIRDVLSKPNCQPSECVWFLNAQIGEQEKAESILREIEIEEHSKAQEEQTAIEFENQLDLLRPHLETYQSFFQLAGNGNSEESFDLLQNHRESAILQKELSKQWNILSQAVRESAESMDSETLESLRKQFIQQVAEAEAGVLSSGEQLGRLRQEQLILLGEETPEELKGVIDALEQERKDQLFRRDRLTVAAALTRMAEERFRASNQPQVVIKTVEILKKLCPDRERPLWLEPDGLYIEPSKGYTVPVDTFAFSTGFRHQIYFALRLALTNRLSKSDEALPIILDEPFAHWDSERTKFGFQVLNELAQKHQIFFFTCRPELLTLATDLPNIGRFYLD